MRSESGIQCALLALFFVMAIPVSACGADGQIKITQPTSFPVLIDQPGSYVLTSNIVLRLLPGDTAIIIDADNVTLDLNGHSLIGDSMGGQGISIRGGNVQIRNGSVRGFGHAIEDSSEDKGPKGAKIINMRVVGNITGIRFFHSTDGQVKGCTVADNTNVGIYVEDGGAMVTGNTVYGNGFGGILTSSGGAIVSGNNVYNNGGFGIEANSPTVFSNTVYANKGDGIVAHGTSTVSGNTVYGNQKNGIRVDCGTVCGNIVADNNQSDETGCGGICVNSSSLVKGNTLRGNLQNNIIVTSSKNAIENNLVTESTNGINFHRAPNFYANNRGSGNTTNFAGFVPTGSGDGGGNVSF